MISARVSDFAHELINDRVQRIEFLSANITQNQGIIVGRETCPDRVAESRLPDPGKARYDFRLSVRNADPLDRRFVTSLENVDKSAVWRPVGVSKAFAASEFVPGLPGNVEKHQR